MSNVQFMDFAGVGAAGNGYIHVPIFEKEIFSLLGKRGVLFQRIKAKKATGHPTRYWEQLAGTSTAAFQDPHALKASKYKTNRVEKSAFIKALTNEIEFGHFDVEVGNQQGIWNGLTLDDIDEMVLDLLQVQDEKVWTGSDTSLTESTTLEYMGLLSQITNTATIADTEKICDAIRTQIATMVADKKYNIRPSAVYVNPLTYDMIEKEEQARDNQHKNYTLEVVAGVKVPAIMTAAGMIPIIPDPYLPIEEVKGTDNKITGYKHKIVLLDEKCIERHYVGSANPRIFGFGLQDESLAKKFMALQYDTVIAKGADYAHCIMTKTVAAA